MGEHEPKENDVEAALRQEPPSGRTPEKLETLFVDHHAQVFRAAYRITGNASDAEDVLQTVFLRLLRLERGGGLSASPSSYLHRAAVNAALDVVRNRRAARTTPLDAVAADRLEGGGDDPERRRQELEVRERSSHALAGLSPKMAEVFALRYFEGYDNHEIARMLESSRSTVAVLLHRARARLKKEIGESPGEPR